jgi:hypothetical protein
MAVRRADGPARGLGRTEGLRSPVVDTACQSVGGRIRQTPYGANPVPANRSTREGKFATGCGITGMPTARGIPRLQPWEEVNHGSVCRLCPPGRSMRLCAPNRSHNTVDTVDGRHGVIERQRVLCRADFADERGDVLEVALEDEQFHAVVVTDVIVDV